MKLKLLVSLIFINVLIGCNQPVTTDASKTDQNTALQKENNNINSENKQGASEEVETSKPLNTVEERPQASTSAGKHPITLQWISWDNPGEVVIKPLDDGWYSIGGSQKNKDGDFLTIDGKIKRLSEKELDFEGTITTKVSSNYGGEPCVKAGKQKFYAKGNRQYFRLQNMTNCEGGMLVDYIDIYKGTSTL